MAQEAATDHWSGRPGSLRHFSGRWPPIYKLRLLRINCFPTGISRFYFVRRRPGALKKYRSVLGTWNAPRADTHTCTHAHMHALTCTFKALASDANRLSTISMVFSRSDSNLTCDSQNSRQNFFPPNPNAIFIPHWGNVQQVKQC